MKNENQNQDVKEKNNSGFKFVRRDFLKLISFTSISSIFPNFASAKDDFRNDKIFRNNTYKIEIFPVFIFAVQTPSWAWIWGIGDLP